MFIKYEFFPSRVFSIYVWMSLISTLFVLAVCFYLTHRFYQNILKNNSLFSPVQHVADFFLITFASLTEPNGLPWFTGFSAGILIHSADPQPWPIVITILHMSIHQSIHIFQNHTKQNNFQMKRVIATGVTLDLDKGIIDEPYLLIFFCFHCHIIRNC